MIIKRIELTNWGPHRSLKADLTANVVGVIGGNGKGKSNFLQAIDYGLNGNLNKQNKELYIYNFGKEDGATKATVKIEFSKNGKDGEIIRTITKSASTRCLKWDGKEYKSDAEVSKQMELILGADKAAMANAVFIKQGCLAALVKGTPAERMAIFQKLMNLAFLDSRYNDIHNRIERLKSGITDYRPALDLVASQISNAKDSITELKTSMVEDPSEELTMARLILQLLDELNTASEEANTARGKVMTSRAALKDILTSFGFTTEQDLQAELTHVSDAMTAYTSKGIAEGRLTSVIASIASCRSELTNYERSRDIVSAAILDNEKVIRLQEELQIVQDKIKNCELRDILLHRLEESVENLEQLKKVAEEKTATYNDLKNANAIEAWAAIVTCKSAELNTLRLRRSYLENESAEDTCPVCGNHMVPLEENVRLEKLAEVKQQVVEIERYKATAEKRRDDAAKQLQEADLAWKLAAGRVDSLAESIIKLRQQIRTVSVSRETIEQLEAEADRLNRTLKAHDTATSEFSSLGRNIASSYKTIELLETEKRDLEQRIATLNASIPDGTDKAALERRLQELRIASTNVAEVSRALIAAEAVLSSKASTVTDISEKLNREDILCALENFSIDDIGIHMNYNSVLSPVIDALEDRDNKYRTAQATLSSLYASMAQLLQHRQELTEKMEAESARLQLIEDLETVGRMTNKNGLPLAYMNSVFDHITDMVQEMLSKMGANFTVIKDDERPCTFRFIRTDDNSGYSMPQEMLSGGQAIRLSLALLIACQQLILPEVGLLVLDEPSSHMDAEGVDSLKELFLQMTSIFHSSETQLITVDHNPSLVAALEKVIQL